MKPILSDWFKILRGSGKWCMNRWLILAIILTSITRLKKIFGPRLFNTRTKPKHSPSCNESSSNEPDSNSTISSTPPKWDKNSTSSTSLSPRPSSLSTNESPDPSSHPSTVSSLHEDSTPSPKKTA